MGIFRSLLRYFRRSSEKKTGGGRYKPPVRDLLTYGDCRKLREWPDYVALGLGPKHIPELVRMATDYELNHADSDTLGIWAPVHAWRALGQLRAEAAIEPLIGLLHCIDEDDDNWAMEELPRVFGMIGPAAVPPLAAFLADTSHGKFARITAAQCFTQIAQMHPDARDECVSVLTRQLERFTENDARLNAFLILPLTELKAVEAAPTIEKAFAADQVDLIVMGDWEDVQVELGLKEAREGTPPKTRSGGEVPSGPMHTRGGKREDNRQQRQAEKHTRAKTKRKRKQAKQSRKRNRKRKKK